MTKLRPGLARAVLNQFAPGGSAATSAPLSSPPSGLLQRTSGLLRPPLRPRRYSAVPQPVAAVASPTVRRPVVVSQALMDSFGEAAATRAPFGSISLADHCLQVATAVHEATWVPDIYRRDMVVMSLFHDLYYNDSQDQHGVLTAQHLEGRIHPHILGLLRHHTDLSEGVTKARETFPVSTHPMLEHFLELDCATVDAERSSLSMDDFRSMGYFDVEKPSSLYQSVRKDSPWLSPNGTLVWAAPSMWIERAPILLAHKLDLFGAAGLPQLEIRITDGGPELVERMRAGDVHIGEIGLFPFLAAVSSGKPVPAKLVGSTFIQQLDHYLVARSPGPESLRELRGLKVGVLSSGSCDSYLLRAMLATVGLDSSDVIETPLGAHYGKAEVLASGEVDALFLVEPALTRTEEMGVAKVLLKASSMYPRFQWGGLFASDCLRQDSPHVLSRTLRVYEAACRSMHSAVTTGAPSDVRAALAEMGPQWFGVSSDTFLMALARDCATWQLQWQSVDFPGVEACMEIQRDLGTFSSGLPSNEEVFDMDILGR